MSIYRRLQVYIVIFKYLPKWQFYIEKSVL